MRVVIITQDEPFYLGKSLDHLLGAFPAHSEVVGCVVNDVSPFGKRENFAHKSLKTLRIFGPAFFAYYSTKFVAAKLAARDKVDAVLARHGVERIELDEPLNSPGSVARIRAREPDLLVSILGNVIFRRPIIELAPQGCLNLHSALLPKYRGLMPAFWVMKHDEPETGISVFFVDEGIDSGPILVQKRVPIEPGETHAELVRRTKLVGMDAILEAVERLHAGDRETLPNDDAESTYFSFPDAADVREFRRAGKRFF